MNQAHLPHDTPVEKPAPLSTPTAILIGSLIIAVGAYLGLQKRAPEAPSAGPSQPFPGPPSAIPAVAPPPPLIAAAPPQPATPSAVVEQQAAAALSSHHDRLVKVCLQPSLQKNPTPPAARFRLNIMFDAEGRQIARGISEERDASRPDVTRCVLAELPPLSIPPPGWKASVVTALSLP